VITAHGLCNVLDPAALAAIAEEFSRVAAPGAQLVVDDYDPLPDGAAVRELFAVENAASELARGRPALTFYPAAFLRRFFAGHGWEFERERTLLEPVPWTESHVSAHADRAASMAAECPGETSDALSATARRLAAEIGSESVGRMYGLAFRPGVTASEIAVLLKLPVVERNAMRHTDRVWIGRTAGELVRFVKVRTLGAKTSIFERISLLMADILLVVGVTLLVAFVFGEALERVGEPALVGEIIAGLVLGPSIIGLIDYDETFAVFGIIGAMLLFFDIGYEHLDLTELLSVGSAAVSIALFGMIIPAGTGLALGLAFDYSVTESAFLALALSVTSIAVTARTLLDLHQLDSRVGHRVVGAAVVDDIVGLVAFALLLLAVSGGGTIEAVTTLGQVIGFFALAVIARFAVIQQLSSLLARSRQIEADILALFGVVFLVSFSAEAVGLDVTLGALMIGLLVGEDERLAVGSP